MPGSTMVVRMTELFQLEWMGGVAEHHYRKARPGVDTFGWETLDAARYTPQLLASARTVWTSLTLSEYAAIAAFAEVVAALTQARAPLDLIGMTSDFLADEVRHVELASRMVMQLGGAAPHPFEPARLSYKTSAELTPFQRANELALRVGCIGEAFASGTVRPIVRAQTHPLVHEIYVSILRDEARHARFGSLYFEWAQEHLDDAECTRLGAVALSTLTDYAPLWRTLGSCSQERQPGVAELVQAHELGWLEPVSYVPVAIRVIRDEILPSLRAIGLNLPESELAALLAPVVPR
jgi:hypothetical protein